MSLFITELAFDDATHIATAKLGILEASVIAGILGYWILNRSLPKTAQASGD
jgi:NhaA family Na+:H+ antiporter